MNFLTVKETAAILGIADRTLREWVSKGIGPRVYRFGSKEKPTLRFKQSEVEDYIRQCAMEEDN